MPISMYDASIPVFVRGLTVLSALLDKAAAHAAANGVQAAALVGTRLAPDMYDLAGQVQRASDTAKLSGARLSGLEAPSFPDTETDIDQLRDRIARTIAYLETIPADALEGSETRQVTILSGANRRVMQGTAYLLTFGLPNFYFHLTTAYDVLRHAGVPVGKLDFLGGLPKAA